MNNQHARVKAIAMEAGEIALRHFNSGPAANIEAKGPLDLVTAADREVEAFICKELVRSFPEDGIFGEEGSAVNGSSGRVWVIDPIDGTFNFVRGSQNWGVSIGLFENGRPTFGVVNAPACDELFAGGNELPAELNGKPLPTLPPFNRDYAAIGVGIHPKIPAEQGVALFEQVITELNLAYRVTGSSVISLIDIAKGNVDGYVGLGIPSWDILGMLPCLEQLGVTTSIDWQTSGLDTDLDFTCGTAGMLTVLRAVDLP
ncbi:inositol monophosphatase family protein [Rhizobium sp. NPDC090275]|uniref:inositol monophosphatase family protein n=1 Tax=Rhizobium sp. NPDC090275 TaxID=3364498 RepID=UPI00383B2770